MINVDFSHAELHDVGFRGLTLERVTLPEDANHVVIRNPQITVDRVIATLKQQADTTASKLVAFLNIDSKWAAPRRAQTVINLQDLAETVGVEGVERLRKLLQQSSSR